MAATAYRRCAAQKAKACKAAKGKAGHWGGFNFFLSVCSGIDIEHLVPPLLDYWPASTAGEKVLKRRYLFPVTCVCTCVCMNLYELFARFSLDTKELQHLVQGMEPCLLDPWSSGEHSVAHHQPSNTYGKGPNVTL